MVTIKRCKFHRLSGCCAPASRRERNFKQIQVFLLVNLENIPREYERERERERSKEKEREKSLTKSTPKVALLNSCFDVDVVLLLELYRQKGPDFAA